MIRLADIEFPSKYLNCYESVLITILKYEGLPEETPLMGTQAYFVLSGTGPRISPRFNALDEEWNRVHGIVVETVPVVSEADLLDKIMAHLDSGKPVCLPVDIYSLPHTLHYQRLHQDHYVDLFGYDDERYYMVCPYYRFADWVDQDLIHSGFFSPVIEYRHLTFIPELRLKKLSLERVQSLVRENCQNMLGLTVPPTLANLDHKCLGLAGIRTLSNLLQELAAEQNGDLPREDLLTISRQIVWVGYSRYWFHKLIQTCQERLLGMGVIADMEKQFTDIVQSWKDVGVRLGAGIHGNRPETLEQCALQLGWIHRQEERLFNSLLGALPGYEEGKL